MTPSQEESWKKLCRQSEQSDGKRLIFPVMKIAETKADCRMDLYSQPPVHLHTWGQVDKEEHENLKAIVRVHSYT